MKEIVKYNNTLNTLQFKGFTAMDYNVLMCLCYKLKDQGQKKLVLTFEELKRLTEFEDQGDKAFVNILERMIEKLIKVNATHITGGKRTYFVLFPTFTIDTDKRTLTVAVNSDFTFILNALTDNFTNFELKEFAELESKYAKALYKSLKQYKISGWWKPTVEELRTVLDVPTNYTNKRIMGDILKPALKALEGKFKGLKCEPIRAQKRGAPIERYYFSFQAEKQIAGQMTIADYPGMLPGENSQPLKKARKKAAAIKESGTNYNELEPLLLDN